MLGRVRAMARSVHVCAHACVLSVGPGGGTWRDSADRAHDRGRMLIRPVIHKGKYLSKVGLYEVAESGGGKSVAMRSASRGKIAYSEAHYDHVFHRV